MMRWSWIDFVETAVEDNVPYDEAVALCPKNCQNPPLNMFRRMPSAPVPKTLTARPKSRRQPRFFRS